LKLVEEAQEAVQAEPENLITELADIYEVMDAVIAAHNIDKGAILAKQRERKTERGSFRKRIRLLWTE
jgi:predicted house-cleaning noncanonical NTP pyrophosphatase (MazG superfamily)